MKNHYQTLLSLVAQTVAHNKKIKKERYNRGEQYNVFNVVGLRSQEVRLHSAFLSNLLNPQGSHGLRDSFLHAFINETGLTDLGLDPLQAQVSVEHYIGPKTETEGGFIDILITDHAACKAIIIENKIYANDQKNQLLRYFNYGKRYKGGCQVLYLTLDGASPSESSLGGDSIAYQCISYASHVHNWLDKCVQLAARQPLVRETLNQYHTLIKQLTYQTMEPSAQNELIDLLTTPQNAPSAVAIFELRAQWTAKVFKVLYERLQSWAEEDREILFESYGNFEGGTRESGFYFHKEEWGVMAIFIYTESTNYRDFYIGISNYKGTIKADEPKIQLHSFSEEPTNTFPFGWNYLTAEFRDITLDVLANILQDDSTFIAYIKAQVEMIFKELDDKKIELY